MSDEKRKNLFAKLAVQSERTASEEAAAAEAVAADTPPALPVAVASKAAAPKKKPEAVKGKRGNPDYCQANAYVPKSLRRSVDRALLDLEDMDYSTLVTDLLRKWLKSRGVSE
jgi:hypothetical protein